MLRPEKMGRVSVTGSKAVLDDVVETAHDLNLLHLTDYDGGWEGFEPGSPQQGADRASEALVTVRSLESILGVDESDAESRPVDADDLYAEIEEIREQVNAQDDRRDELTDELRSVEEELDSVRPFVELGIDLDLLDGYDNLSVAVGEGDEESVRAALVEQPGVDSHETFAADESDVLAVFAYPAVDITDALVGAQFTSYEVPDLGEGGESISPEQYVDELEARRRDLQADLEEVEEQLDRLREDYGGFLLAAEEKLAVKVQKAEAPLSFATTENAFVAEGWLPYDEYVDLAEGLQDAVGDHVDVDLLEVADYNEDGHPTDSEDVAGGAAGGGVGEPAAADGGEVASDGGRDLGRIAEADVATDGAGADVAMSHSTPPVIQDNPGPVKPFEALVEVINRPKYSELDPTVILFLTFPVFYGFMIGDLGYGILYMLLGGALMTQFDSDIIRSLGGVGVLAGFFTAIFGVLYGEFFGLHQLGEIVWGGSPPIHKGLIPEYSDYALGWLVLSLIAGVLHLTVGWIFDFYENLSHGFKDAMLESGSWLMMMFGLWAWIFAGASGSAPDLIYGADSVFNGNPFPLGFAGFSPTVGLAGLAVFGLGLVLLVAGEPIEGVEFLNVLVNVLSYTRLAAVLLAKAGMAFVVNLLFFGVWVTETESGPAWHFGIDHSPAYYLEQGTYHGHEVTEVMFGGLVHGGIGAALGGIVILVLGHLLVLALGVTSAGLQAVRLEYVEFFGKFYEGGGDEYEPFGYETRFAGDD
ncbi:V-type ATP synthase subunit I [Haloglomus litoreum]|uniref:V-type ATP synthase subunit I n=1 Tax=Haloglomus litoreum TaxID=3034026 RepID=UPI0023E8ED04|nr:V-type ATP synthase subunit I [Haloglomus sp. DT116]